MNIRNGTLTLALLLAAHTGLSAQSTSRAQPGTDRYMGPISIGEVTLPLGPLAFPRQVQCLSPVGACGGHYYYFEPVPPYRQLGWGNSLYGENLGEAVFADASDQDDLRLVFPVPVRNQPGPDLYLAQAEFLSGQLGLIDGGLHPFSIRFRGEASWHTLAPDQFQVDLVEPLHGIVTSDAVGGQLVGSLYATWYHLLDLSDYGFGPSDCVHELNIRGPAVPSWPETAGLDVVAVASLNSVRPGGGCPATGHSIAGTAVFDSPNTRSVVLSVNGPLNTAVATSWSSAPLTTSFRVPDLPDGAYALTPASYRVLFLPTTAHVSVAGENVGGVGFAAYWLPVEPTIEFEGDIVALDPQRRTLTLQKGATQTTYSAHVAAVFSGVAGSIEQLQLGLRAKGDAMIGNPYAIATAIRTE